MYQQTIGGAESEVMKKVARIAGKSGKNLKEKKCRNLSRIEHRFRKDGTRALY